MKKASNRIWPYFRSRAHQADLEEKGYVIIRNFATEAVLKALDTVLTDNDPNLDRPFYVSNFCADESTNSAIDIEVRRLLDSSINVYLQHHREIIGLFFLKKPGSGSSYHVHRDWALVDERKYNSLHLWLPLTDIDETNGNLFVFEGSHTDGPIVRGSPSFEFPKDGLLQRLQDRFGRTDLYLKRGDALLFDHRIKHGSRANRSKTARKVIGVSIVPDEAPLIHYHRFKDDKIEIFEVDDKFYLNFNLRDTPVGQSSLGYIDDAFYDRNK